MRSFLSVVAIGLGCIGLCWATEYPAAVVPVYTAVHAKAQAQGTDDLGDKLDKLTAAVERLTAVLEAIERGPATEQPAADPVAIAKANCLGCHSQSAAEEKGFGFRLFDEGGAAFAPLNNRDRLRVANRISDGSMPPPKSSKLTDAERKVLADHFKK
jgi:mono/diheme cytochrome c family protein